MFYLVLYPQPLHFCPSIKVSCTHGLTTCFLTYLCTSVTSYYSIPLICSNIPILSLLTWNILHWSFNVTLQFGRVSSVAQWWKSICQGRKRGFDSCRRKWQPTPEFLPGKLHGQRSLEATVYGAAKESKWLNNNNPSRKMLRVSTEKWKLENRCPWNHAAHIYLISESSALQIW